jgi:hypothetical protein
MCDVTLRTSTAKSFQFLSQKAPLKALKAAANPGRRQIAKGEERGNMSFQHFRLSEAVSPLPAHLHAAVQAAPTSSVQQFQTANTNNTFPMNHVAVGPATPTKAPYGSGDTDDGYTLVFPNLEAFHEWRNKEEETQMVEFVKVLASLRGIHLI